LEIHGVPEWDSKDMEEIVLNLEKCINVELTPEDIEICHARKEVMTGGLDL